MHKYVAGDRIAHPGYGDGTVASVNEYHTRINFDDYGLHTFISTMVKLAPSVTPEPPPPEPRRRKGSKR